MRNMTIAIGLILIALLLPIVGLGARLFASREVSLPSNERTPFFRGTGTYNRKVTTTSGTAQGYFDQGLAFLYGFNHEGALASFRSAADADPNCAMAHWGIAAALGPDINDPEPTRQALIAAHEAILKAQNTMGGGAAVEKSLINALAQRYIEPEAVDRQHSDQVYAEALADLAMKHPEDPDVCALKAEAFMVLAALAAKKQSKAPAAPDPQGDVVATLRSLLKRCPNHPLALHLWIHACEALRPKKAVSEADRLRQLCPGIGHLVHMPSHVDIRLGRWQQAIEANELAIAADHMYRRLAPGRGSHAGYMSHSENMLLYAAMMQGQSTKATLAAEEMLSRFTPQINRVPGDADVLFAMAYEIHMRFGRWEAMLAEPEPTDSLPFTRSMRHFARGIAFAALKRTKEAKGEQLEFVTSRKQVTGNLLFRGHPVGPIFEIAVKMLEGEILYREGKVAEAIAALGQAVRHEDELDYAEPPLWMLPVRHALGATLMDAERYAEAERVYRDDLLQHPENGWSLNGLFRSLKMQDKKVEADLVRQRFEKAWRYADVKISSSCCCLPARTEGPQHEHK
jgi:tetratricopeptide (TPR) repeat protein